MGNLPYSRCSTLRSRRRCRCDDPDDLSDELGVNRVALLNVVKPDGRPCKQG
jgi:hypothetical protein